MNKKPKTLLVDIPFSTVKAAMRPAWESQLPERTREQGVFDPEVLRAEGLDPEVYCGYTWADCAVGDTVNLNTRIYPKADFIAGNNQLNARIQAGDSTASYSGVTYVAGERNHPGWLSRDLGQTSLNTDAVKWLEITVIDEPGKVPLARGKFAFLNTQAGRDLAVLCRAGKRIGISARAFGDVEQEQITADSPYWYVEANRRFVGAWVDVIRNWSMGEDGTYDVVDVPAAGAWLDSAAPEVRDAYRRLLDSGFKQEVQMFTQEQVAQLVGDAVTKARAEHWSAKVDGVLVKAIEANLADAAKLKAAVADALGLTDKLKAAQTEAETAKADAAESKAKLAKLELDSAIKAKIDSLAAGSAYPGVVRDFLTTVHASTGFASAEALDSVAASLVTSLSVAEKTNPASAASNAVAPGASTPTDAADSADARPGVDKFTALCDDLWK